MAGVLVKRAPTLRAPPRGEKCTEDHRLKIVEAQIYPHLTGPLLAAARETVHWALNPQTL